MHALTVLTSSSWISSLSSSQKAVKEKQLGKKEEEEDQEHRRPQGTVHFLTTPLLSAILTLSNPLVPVPATFSQPEFPKGTALFQKACIGCHDRGGNILQPGATLFIKDLQRNGLATEDDIYNITYYGKGRMPGFGERCTPRGQCTFGPRLKEEEIKQIAGFVKLQAERGWPNIETYGD
ncbi:cytochrome c6, chloroplastic [Phalaenopsis equestris]|uniref:cytochrome c6, chloroplastic n=1 Tax=Phalaenopsis equestris TaxID=78828 RepID=UPI0009E42AB9|nr:cytochrome c6, chloroplastic [Phalaenopsis equestris]